MYTRTAYQLRAARDVGRVLYGGAPGGRPGPLEHGFGAASKPSQGRSAGPATAVSREASATSTSTGTPSSAVAVKKVP